MTEYAGIRLTTERLVLRAWRPDDDAEAAFAIYGDPEVQEFLTGTAVPDIETQRAELGQIVEAYTRMANGMGSFAVELADGGEVVGCGLLKPLPRSEHTPEWRAFRDGGPVPQIHEIEVGWHLARRHWGKGYATEAARGLLEYGFGTLGLEAVYAVFYAANRRSANVVKRLGMRRLGETDAFYGVSLELAVAEGLEL